MPTPLHEAQWVLRAQCDDREALELLLRSVQPALFRAWAFRIASRAAFRHLKHSKLLLAATGAPMSFIGICAVLVSFHVTRMTRTVLNAIELLRR